MTYLALGLFIATYILLLVFVNHRAYVALASAAIFIILGFMPLGMIGSAIDWNVLLMICGTMGTVALFIESKMPGLLADIVLERVPNVKWAVIALSFFAGIVSAFVDNVATVLMVAPVALAICKRLEISPVPVIIAIAVSSNLQGAATLVGDTTSIMLGGYAGMSFIDFFVFRGRAGLFWIVELGAAIATCVLLILFRKQTQPVSATERTKVTDFFPSVLMILTVLILIIISFVENKPDISNGLVCTLLFVIGLVKNVMQRKDKSLIKTYCKEIDWQTLMLLAGLFIVVVSIREAGIIDMVAHLFVSISGDNLFIIFTLIVWASVLLSAFIDNIPYVATMLPVVQGISSILGIEPYLLYFGLLVGATLGGNLTPIGASANITGIGILRKAGYQVTTKDFCKIGVPFTLAAVVSGYILTWLIWS